MTHASQQLYPLTSSQREIWFDQMLHPDIPHYNIGIYVKIPSVVEPKLFERAVNLLVQQHDSLRTVLQKTLDEDGIPLQRFAEQLHVTVPVTDFSSHSEPHETAVAWINTRFQTPFTGVIGLDGQALFRYDLLKLAPDCFYYMVTYHHLISDGWDIALLNRSLAEIYTQLVNDQEPDLDSISYIDFIEDDRRYVESKTFEKNKQYWLNQYPTAPEPLLTPSYQSKYSDSIIASGCENLYLPRDLYQNLERLAKKKSGHHVSCSARCIIRLFHPYRPTG